jgi:PleD family two-component response regulator
VVAFDRGVDDFISKSANQFELAARVYGTGRNAFQQNALRERMRSLSSQFLRIKQFSLQDPETSLPNRAQLELHVESLIEHSSTRGGGLGVGLIEVSTEDGNLRLGTLKTIANSIQLALRPMDMVARYNVNTFAVSVQYIDPDAFSPELFQRLINNVKRHTQQTSDQGKQLKISVGFWHGHGLDPAPTVSEIISFAHQSCEPIN